MIEDETTEDIDDVEEIDDETEPEPEEPGKPSIALIGECMIELREQDDGTLTRGYGGDVLNTSVYLARLAGDDADVRFVTVLGDDPFSDEMITGWQAEGIVTDCIGRKEEANAGLYMVQTDADGERSFHYWRDHSPAREMMELDWEEAVEPAFTADGIYLSGITLAILDDPGRQQLLDHLEDARNKDRSVIFDGNFRPSLWSDPGDAVFWHERVWEMTTMALAGAADEARIFGDETPEDTGERLSGYGIPEIVIKRGAEDILVGMGDDVASVAVDALTDVLDTTAAGDSFNAAYIDARIRGLNPLTAAERGAVLARTVIQHSGAVIPLDDMPDLSGILP